jgi:hypothetical protein
MSDVRIAPVPFHRLAFTPTKCGCRFPRKLCVGYYKVQVESVDPAEQTPPHNILRKCMYRKVAMTHGFICRQKHPHCVQLGIRQLSKSPDGNYMGQMDF